MVNKHMEMFSAKCRWCDAKLGVRPFREGGHEGPQIYCDKRECYKMAEVQDVLTKRVKEEIRKEYPCCFCKSLMKDNNVESHWDGKCMDGK